MPLRLVLAFFVQAGAIPASEWVKANKNLLVVPNCSVLLSEGYWVVVVVFPLRYEPFI
jgi:hypothetical protein